LVQRIVNGPLPIATSNVAGGNIGPDKLKPRMRRAVVVAAVMMGAVVAMQAQPASAQPNSNRTAQVARAEQYFNEAKKLLEHNEVAKACNAFAESQKLDPQLGTLLNLALCHEREGKNASAWSEFTTVVSLATRAGQAKRAELAKEHAKQLEPKLARVRFDVSQLPPDAKVAIDGAAPVERATLEDVSMPIDAGMHAAQVTAAGKKPSEEKFEITGGPGTVAAHKFRALAIDDTPPPPPPKPKPAFEPKPIAPPEPSGGLSALQWTGIGAAGVGVIGIGVGTFFGLRAASLKDDAACTTTCTTEGDRILADARSAGTVSTISFIAGGALLVGGALLYFLAPNKRAAPTTTTALVTF